jgi:hypothetical protein
MDYSTKCYESLSYGVCMYIGPTCITTLNRGYLQPDIFRKKWPTKIGTKDGHDCVLVRGSSLYPFSILRQL